MISVERFCEKLKRKKKQPRIGKQAQKKRETIVYALAHLSNTACDVISFCSLPDSQWSHKHDHLLSPINIKDLIKCIAIKTGFTDTVHLFTKHKKRRKKVPIH